MRAIAEKLQSKPRVKAFFNAAIFGGKEVNYLTIKHNDAFHVFAREDVLSVLAQHLEITNSQARQAGQVPEQKVVFRYNGTNLAELEMRTESEVHYRRVRFNMLKQKAMFLLFAHIPKTAHYSSKVAVYGSASKHFARWNTKKNNIVLMAAE